MKLAPIVLFTYNRPDHTRQTLEALQANDLADASTLYIYSDGPKHGVLEEDLQKITAVRKLIRSKEWCKEVKIVESERNMGLADSVVVGVTEVVNRHGRVIVLEDDIVTKKGFLRFMNEALEMYADDNQVMHISGMIFGTPKRVKETTLFLNILSCHGWATWKRAWDHYTHDIDVLFERITQQGISHKKFDIEGNAHFYNQLEANRDVKLYTWAVRWYASWLTSGGYSLFPYRSLVTNIGHDGSGEHSSASFYNGETVDTIKLKKIPIQEDLVLRKEIDQIWKSGRNRNQGEKISKWARVPIVLMKSSIRKTLRWTIKKILPELSLLEDEGLAWAGLISNDFRSKISRKARLYKPYHLNNVTVGDYTYILPKSWISMASIGKFCSIGPRFHCGGGIHPIDGISTSPMFYSTSRINGSSLSSTNKAVERKTVVIGNDVFIGMNVTVLDGVTIGDGAVVGAGCIVSKDVPSFAVVVGNPMRIIRYRFSEKIRTKLIDIKWWEFDENELSEVEKNFFDIEKFIKRFDK